MRVWRQCCHGADWSSNLSTIIETQELFGGLIFKNSLVKARYFVNAEIIKAASASDRFGRRTCFPWSDLVCSCGEQELFQLQIDAFPRQANRELCGL